MTTDSQRAHSAHETPTDDTPTPIFGTNAVLTDIADRGLWFEEVTRRNAISTAIYQLPPGTIDPQVPHGEDEIYYVIAGYGSLNTAGVDVAVKPGDLIDIRAGTDHHFHTITEQLQLLAIFAPAFDRTRT